MGNPFLYERALGNNASINKLILKKLPVKGIEDDIEGKSAYDIFSTRLVVEAIKEQSEALKLNLSDIEERDLPIYLGQCLESKDKKVRATAENIIEVFGKRLALILLTLKKGEMENREARKDWEEVHWKYWSNLENVILVGGLASGALGKGLKYWIEKVFYLAAEIPFSILLVEDSTYAAIAGCVEYIYKKDSVNLIFDFGQSFIKRSIIKKTNGKLYKVHHLPKKPSLNMDWIYDDDSMVRRQAEELNDYLIGILCDTFRDADKSDIGEEIIISIANYVNKGVLLEGRGGYAKLFHIAANYEKYLCDALTKRLNRVVKVKLVHDGTAMAAAFKNYKNSVCLSLGTAFGVGYPINE